MNDYRFNPVANALAVESSFLEKVTNATFELFESSTLETLYTLKNRQIKAFKDEKNMLVYVLDHQEKKIVVHTSEIEGYCVLILNRHVTYLHDLTEEEFAELSGLLKTMSKTLTHVFKAKLINVACLGNVVDHLHWHFIPRTESDPKWGGPIWAGAPLKTVHREDRLTAETVRLILNQLVSN